MTCPDCNGKGESQCLAGGTLRKTPCLRCGITGEIPESMVTWIKLGELLKECRMKPYRPVWKEAARLGVLSADLSAAENGRVDPVPYLTLGERGE